MIEMWKWVHHIVAIWELNLIYIFFNFTDDWKWLGFWSSLTDLGFIQKPKEWHVTDSSMPESGEKSCLFTLAWHISFYWHCRNCVTFCLSCEGPRPGGDHHPDTAPVLHPGHLTGFVHCALLLWTQSRADHGAWALPPPLAPPTHAEASPQAWPAGHWWWESVKENVCNLQFNLNKGNTRVFFCV